MITNVSKQGNLTTVNVTGDAVILAKQAGAGYLGKDRYFFWTREWKAFLALARKAKIEVEWKKRK